MNQGEREQFVANKVLEATAWCKTMGDFSETLGAMSYTLGSLVVEFPQDEREHLFIQMVEFMAKGLMATSKAVGEPCNLEMTKGFRTGADKH
ncbi:hypothetical protein MMB75_25340 [Paenibacillus sp. P2(2022)]|uniref:hypothetical protein n=1 Tax=Paenibacillus sp. P2(2022) TaxID=2917813 RepID=UPI0024060507|nr:hypothetical protein [Paenibacillus sp. P2(2022)]MDG0056953.1 hypothetical protein [Paenibacillus sp. P2(2022)]